MNDEQIDSWLANQQFLDSVTKITKDSRGNYISFKQLAEEHEELQIREKQYELDN